MTEILRPTAAELRAQIAEAERQYPDLAKFDAFGGDCECCGIDRFADLHGWANANVYRRWENARWLLGEDA